MTFDNLALALAIAAVLFRLLDRPYWSNLFSTATILASSLGRRAAHRRHAEALASAEARRSVRPAR